MQRSRCLGEAAACRLDDEVRGWREDLEGKGWFSPRELDELEDHLRSHAAEARELDSTLGPAPAFGAAVREEIGDPPALFREFAKSETPRWRPLLLAGWGLYGLSLLLPGFGIVAFEPSNADFGISASGWEFLRLALTNGWILAWLPNLAMAMTFAVFGRVRRRLDRWLGRALGAVSVSALGFGILNLLRPLPVTVDGDLVMYGHLGPAYWAWSVSFALVATAAWARAREWASDPPKRLFV